MSLVRNGLLALTALSPSYGLQLRNEITRRTGRVLNAAQVYTTLDRLARDGFVEVTGQTADGLDLFRATDKGSAATDVWLRTPEKTFEGTVFQVMMALSIPGFDPSNLFSASREYWENKLTEAEIEPELSPCDLNNEHTPARQKIANLFMQANVMTAKSALEWLCEADECCGKGYPINAERPARGRPASR